MHVAHVRRGRIAVTDVTLNSMVAFAIIWKDDKPGVEPQHFYVGKTVKIGVDDITVKYARHTDVWEVQPLSWSRWLSPRTRFW